MRGTIDMALVPAFIEVVRQGSFTKAAAVLELPKSTVSRHVSRLEASLSVQLLVRTTRKLRLTDDGETFYARVANALEAVEEAARAVTEQNEEPHGLLRITIPSDFERMPPVVASFVARYPKVTVEVNITGEVVDLVGEGYDLAVRAGHLRDSSLVARKLASVEFHLFASCAYVQAHGLPTSVQDLANHECVLFRPHHGTSRWKLTGPDGKAEVEVTGRTVADDLNFARGLVLAGAGIGLLPSQLFGDARDNVRRILGDYAMPGGAVHVVYPGSRHVSAKVRAFRDHLLAVGAWDRWPRSDADETPTPDPA